MPLVTSAITLQERRDLVRELSDITTNSYTDTEIDQKMDVGDIEAKVWLQTSITSDLLIVLSNYLTARNILKGIGGDDNIRTAEAHMSDARALVNAHNNKAEEQNQFYTSTTDTILHRNEDSDY